MIDYVRLSAGIEIADDYFRREKWRERRIPSGTLVRYHRFRGVWIRYYPETSRMTISGKLLMLLEDSEVLNVDDVYEQDIPQFVSDLNDHLNGLFVYPYLNVLEFHVNRIDYCFNVQTPYVREYIDFLNKAFQRTDNGKFVNYTLRHHLSGSAYIKTKSDYDHNERRNYVLNFYDKTDRLNYLLRRGHHIGKHDLEYARGILRLEVQCGHQLIKWLCKKFDVDPVFGDLLAYKIAYRAEAEVYKRVYHCDETHDYYTYKAAQKRIPNKSACRQALLEASQGHKIRYDSSKKQIKDAGIFPFCCVDKNIGIDMLENPIRLIRKKLAEREIFVDAE